ncbi:hypothetical protein WICPIJ_006514 [Wickerhamomyces pijperi]|uniref:Autophagy-related protein 11 n=1 Tax=Wickerhamomyces pijperi TaxID=599730 RepID=A0A9P8Q208_WICPI|nr:hypothetical protein WICPIJ_006514 [Wickerhamomyces pijperi]
MSNNKDLITIYNSHSGDSFRVNRHYFVSLEEIKKFCSKQFSIPIQQIFLISPFGLKLKITFLEQLDEVYVFDRNLFSVYNDEQTIRRYIHNKYSIDSLKENLVQPIHSPLEDIDLNRVTHSRNARQLMGLLTTNLGWVSAIQSDTKLFTKRSKDVAAKTLILLKALKVACQYIESYCGDIKNQFDTSVDSVINIQRHSLNLSWGDHLKKLGGVNDINQKPLSDLLNRKELSDVAHESIKLNESLNSSFIAHKSQLKSSRGFREGVDTDLTALEKEIIVYLNALQLDTKVQNVNQLCDKLQSDTKNLLSQSNAVDDISIDLILDSFTTQKSKFVAQIFQQSNELFVTLKKLIDIFNKVQLQTCTFLQRLSQAQADMVTLKESLKDLTSKTESIQSLESKLCLTIDLPLLYGLFLTECLRRDEWSKRVKMLASSTNENFAAFKEKEAKVRSLWLRNYGEVLSLLGIASKGFNGSGMLSIDLNLIEESDSSSESHLKVRVTYDDVIRYVEQLQSLGINTEIVNLLSKNVNEIPSKLAKVKLMDLVSDLESSTTLTAADKDTIKGLKTRIKKLENLLHQKSFQPNVITGPPESKFSAMAKRSVLNTAINGSENEVPGGSKSLTPKSSSNHQAAVDSTQFLKLQDENMHLTTDLKSQRGKLETITEELRSLKQTLSTKEFENQTLLKRLENLQDEKSNDISRLQLELTMVQVDKGNLESELQKKADELDVLHRAHEDDKVSHCEALKKELDSWKIKFEDHEKDLLLLRTDKEKESKLVQLARDELEDVKDQLELMTSEKNVIEGRLSTHVSENKKTSETLKIVRKENQKLKDNLKNANKSGDSFKAERDQLTLKLSDSENQIKQLKDQLGKFKSESAIKDNKINEFKELLSEKDRIITQQSEELATLTSETTELKSTAAKHESKLHEWEDDYEKLLGMKNDLLENMTNREAEFAKEKTAHHEEADLLKARVEELEKQVLTAEAESLANNEHDQDTNTRMDISEKQANTIFQLVIIINSLIIKSRDLSEILFQLYEILCGSLKSLGLLAVRNEETDEISIIRYKGLRKLTDGSALDLPPGVSAGLISQVEQHLLWTQLPDTTELISDLNQDSGSSSGSGSLDSIVETLIENYNLTSFEEKYVNFAAQITNLFPLYPVHIAKRFEEVEVLARKELKDKRKLKLEIQKLKLETENKISVRNFQKGDLVLFLPAGTTNATTEDGPEESSWAAFNDMKDVKFMKKFDPDWDTLESNKVKQWFIGKVLDIEEVDADHGEFQISAQQVEV